MNLIYNVVKIDVIFYYYSNSNNIVGREGDDYEVICEDMTKNVDDELDEDGLDFDEAICKT